MVDINRLEHTPDYAFLSGNPKLEETSHRIAASDLNGPNKSRLTRALWRWNEAGRPIINTKLLDLCYCHWSMQLTNGMPNTFVFSVFSPDCYLVLNTKPELEIKLHYNAIEIRPVRVSESWISAANSIQNPVEWRPNADQEIILYFSTYEGYKAIIKGLNTWLQAYQAF